jgi:hypothetical protein
MWIVQQLHHRVDLLLIVVVILRGMGVMECMLRLLRLWYPGSHRCHSLRLCQAREHPSLQRWRVPSSRLFVWRVVLVVLVFRLVRRGILDQLPHVDWGGSLRRRPLHQQRRHPALRSHRLLTDRTLDSIPPITGRIVFPSSRGCMRNTSLDAPPLSSLCCCCTSCFFCAVFF